MNGADPPTATRPAFGSDGARKRPQTTAEANRASAGTSTRSSSGTSLGASKTSSQLLRRRPDSPQPPAEGLRCSSLVLRRCGGSSRLP